MYGNVDDKAGTINAVRVVIAFGTCSGILNQSGPDDAVDRRKLGFSIPFNSS